MFWAVFAFVCVCVGREQRLLPPSPLLGLHGSSTPFNTELSQATSNHKHKHTHKARTRLGGGVVKFTCMHGSDLQGMMSATQQVLCWPGLSGVISMHMRCVSPSAWGRGSQCCPSAAAFDGWAALCCGLYRKTRCLRGSFCAE